MKGDETMGSGANEPTGTPIYSIWPGETFFGRGVAGQVGEQVRRLGGGRVLLVTDPGVQQAGLVDRILDSLRAGGPEPIVFGGVEANPSDELIDDVAEELGGEEPDVLVAVGGGSSIDTAKSLQLVLYGGGHIRDYDLAWGDQVRPTPRHKAPLIAIPTTSGTGSEVTAWAVVTDTSRRVKFSVGDAGLIPAVALVDPEMTRTLPPSLTAATGMDALSHCLESYVSTVDNSLGDLLSLQGVRLVAENLRRAVAHGDDMQARANMALASMLGGMSLNLKWGGACHSLAHVLSSDWGLSHGVSIGLMLPHQMEYSLAGALDKYAQVAEAFGPTTGSLAERAQGAVTAVRSLIADLGLPCRLREVGVVREALPAMAEKAMRDDSHMTNPRPCDIAGLEEIYARAF